MNKVLLILFTISISSCSIMRKKATYNTFSKYAFSTDSISYFPLYWDSDTIAGRFFDKVSIRIPVNIDRLADTVFMQLDLGANITMIYGNTLEAFIQSYPELLNRCDTVKDSKFYFNDVTISLGDQVNLHANKIRIIKDFGSVKIDTSIVMIGTLGYDIIGRNKLILDYKNDRFAIAKEIPQELADKINYIEKADLDKFPIILPFVLDGKKARLFFDTGSSMFSVLTGTNRLNKITDKSNIDTLCCVSSWGREKQIYYSKKSSNLELGNISFGLVDVFGDDDLNKMKIIGKYLYGITGNVNFNNMILVIDKANNSFGIIE